MKKESMPLAAFARDLRGRLKSLSAERLRDIVLLYSQGLPNRDRAAFLELFGPQTGDHRDDNLLADIDSFVSDLETGKYYDAFGWDDEIRDQRSFGDESWVQDMDGLFARTNESFLGGDMPQAREAYAALFRSFGMDEEVGMFCGQKPATEMVGTDLREASARHLRTICHTSAADEMPAALRDAWTDDLPYENRPVSIDEVRQSLPEDPPELDHAFWPRWIDELRWVESDPLMRGLLAEAVQHSTGVDGLAVLAREHGDRQADHCLAWIDAVSAEGRDTDAVAAARESLTMVTDPGPGRARIADRLAELDGLEDARREAWRAEPTSLRLRALFEANPDLTAEVERRPGGMDGRLLAELLLLAGEVDQAVRLLDGDTADHVSPVLLPYLLAAGSGAPALPDWTGSALAALFDDMDRKWGVVTQTPPARLPDLLIRGLAIAAPRRRWLKVAGAEVEHLISRIVSAKQQFRYGEAAVLAVCHAEAVAFSGGDGAALLRSVRDTYPRHQAFKKQLRRAMISSAKMASIDGTL